MNDYSNKYDIVKRYKLTKEQVEIYLWVKDQKINTDDGTICYWVKKYSPQRIRDVVCFANTRRNSGQKIHNVGGWIRWFLETEQIVVNEASNINHDFCVKFVESRKWAELKIFEKYVRDTITGDDLPLTMGVDDFRRSLEALYQKSQLYK